MLFISGNWAHSGEFSGDAYARVGELKELPWVSSAGRTDVYGRVDLIPINRLTEFFQANLDRNWVNNTLY